ncbi:MAG: carbohydrate ABC transporter permease [Epulopiscium sp.]|nr:carbohydrate ABC transporter permease [Candidatus Epulonipiscium sp.]
MNKLKIKIKTFIEKNKKSNGYHLKKTMGSGIYRFLRAILLFGLCFLIIQPLLNKISVSFMAEKDLYDATVISIPRNFTLDNYKLTSSLINYPKALFTSAWVAFIVSLLQIASCTLVGYGFARFKFPFKNFWFACVILVIVIPPQTIMTSLYLHFKFFDIFGLFKLFTGNSINLINTMFPYLMMVLGCMGLKSGLYIFMIRQFFRGVPKDIEEAAYIDGCGKFKTFYAIMLPDAKPIITSCFLFAYVWQWTDSFYSNMFLRHLTLLPGGLRSISERLSDWVVSTMGTGYLPSIGYTQAMISTGILMTIVPLFIIYLIAQKGFVESISQSGIKM